MKVAGLFAGIGGLEIGLSRAGHSAVMLNEILPAAQAVLRARFSESEITSDVCELKSLSSEVELITAGFPCQDLSQAGQTRGIAGSRSGLISEVFRLVRSNRPKWVLLENVPFMLQLSKGDAVRSIVAEFEELDYRWCWRVVDTNGFGLPQRRQRVYLLASIEGNPADVLLCDDNPFVRPRSSLGNLAHGFYWTEGRGGLGWAVDAIPTLKNGSSVGIPSPPAILMPNGLVVKPDIRDAERLQGFPSDWTAPAEEFARSSARWGLIGNSVSTPVSEWVGNRLKNPGQYDVERDRPFPALGTLPKAARSDGTSRYAVEISSDPVGIASPHLHSFLQFPGLLLSERATKGFLSRTRTAKLRFEPGFIGAIERHLMRVGGPYPTDTRLVA